MRINKRYLVGFGVFAVTAGLYGVVTFRSYTQLQAGASPFGSAPQSNLNASPNAAADVSASNPADKSAVMLSGNSASSAAGGSVATTPDANFVGPLPENQMGLANKASDVRQDGTQKPAQDRSENSGKPQAQMNASEIKDETAQAQVGEVFGPADSSIKPMVKVQAAAKPVVVKPVADEVASDFDVIASADQAVNDEIQPDTRESWLKSLGISMSQFRVIQQREERLTKEVKEVEKVGAEGSKELLVTEYKEWLREYLGPDRYVRFNELAAK